MDRTGAYDVIPPLKKIQWMILNSRVTFLRHNCRFCVENKLKRISDSGFNKTGSPKDGGEKQAGWIVFAKGLGVGDERKRGNNDDTPIFGLST